MSIAEEKFVRKKQGSSAICSGEDNVSLKMNTVQKSIVQIATDWGHSSRNCPVPLQKIVSELDEPISKDMIKYSIRALIKQGYLRKSVVRSKTVSYILLRSM